NPIQKPSRRCGYCARAADAAQENAASRATTRAVECMGPPWPVTAQGSGDFHARRGEHGGEVAVSSPAVSRPSSRSVERDAQPEIDHVVLQARENLCPVLRHITVAPEVKVRDRRQ